MRDKSHAAFLILQLCSLFSTEQGFYVPGVAPVEFRDGDPIEVKVFEFRIILPISEKKHLLASQLVFKYYPNLEQLFNFLLFTPKRSQVSQKAR